MADTNTAIAVGGALVPDSMNTPLDSRTRVWSRADIANIANPYQGMRIYIDEEDKQVLVTSLEQVKQGILTVYRVKEVVDVPSKQDLNDIDAKVQELTNKVNKLQGADITYEILQF